MSFNDACFLTKTPRFFSSPLKTGRQIICGFSFLQRIGKAATTDLWFSNELKNSVAERIAFGDSSVLDEFKCEWAAVRQFELLQEAGNLAIEDLEVADFDRAFQNLIKMRAGGYRVSVITLGRYVDPIECDELQILDRRLQDEITRLIHMLYLESQSSIMTKTCADVLANGKWSCASALPHVSITLGAERLFSSSKKSYTSSITAAFFKILDLLPQNHVAHDVAIGLALPEATAQRNWIYLAKPEHQYHAFQTALATVFRSFDHISLSALHGRADASREHMPVMHHMRGYGDRISGIHEEKNRLTAQFAEMALNSPNF